MSACHRCNGQPSDAEVVCRDCGVSVIDVLRAEVERLRGLAEQTAIWANAERREKEAERQRCAEIVRDMFSPFVDLRPSLDEALRRILDGESQG